jgi:hypothetical protein
MRCNEKEEIRKDISLLRSLIDLEIEDYGISFNQHLKSIVGLKKLIRKKLADYNNRTDDRHFNSDGESFYYKEWFDYPFTEEDKQEFIEDNWVSINLPWSPTGKWFTSHIAVCNVETSFGKKAVAYHFMSLDC